LYATYGVSLKLFFITLQESDGSLVGSYYKSNNDCSNVNGAALSNNAVYGAAFCSSNWILVRYDISTDTFSSFYLSLGGILTIKGSSTSSEIKFYGVKSTKCWLSTLYFAKIASHSDFTADTTSLAMSVATGHSFNNAADTLSTLTSSTFTLNTSPGSASVTYQELAGNSWTENIVYYTSEETISMNSADTFSKSPDVTCSTTGQTVTYSLSGYGEGSVLSWITIDASTGVISGTTPNVQTKTSFLTYIDSTSSEFTGTSQKLLTIQVSPPSVDTKNTTLVSRIATYIVLSLVIFCIVLATMNSLISGTFYLTTWKVIMQVQMIFVVLLIEPNPTEHILYFLEWLNFSLINFNFLPLAEISFLADWMDFEQTNESLKAMDLESRSTVLNHVSFFVVFLVLAFIHLIVELVFKLVKTKEIQTGRFSLSAIKTDLLHLFRYVLYVRLIWLAATSLLLSSVKELDAFEFENAASSFSTVVALGVFIAFCIFILVALLYNVLAMKYFEQGKEFVFMEFFSGIKNSPIAMTFTPVHLLRKVIFISIILFISAGDRITAYAVILTLQVVYCVFVMIIRPFRNLYDNLILMVNEVFIAAYIIIIVGLDFYNEWTDLAAELFLFTIVLNFLIVLGLLVANLIKSILYPRKGTAADPAESSTEKDINREESYKESKMVGLSQFNKQPAEESQDQPDVESPYSKKQGRSLKKLDTSVFSSKRKTINIAL
jgi:hypothetical protein